MAILSFVAYFIANIALLLFFLVCFCRKYIPQELHTLFKISLVWKLLFSVLLSIVFYYYFPYQADPKALFQASLELQKNIVNHPEKLVLLWNNQWDVTVDYSGIPRAFFLVKILWCLNFLTGANYWLNNTWLSIISFGCTWVLCLQVRKMGERPFVAVAIALLFVPSTVFWSSGILKESLSFGSLCILTSFFIRVLSSSRFSWKEFILLLVASYILLRMRFYVLGAFILVSLPTYLSYQFSSTYSNTKKGRWTKPLVFLLSFLLICWVMDYACLIMMGADIAELTYYTHDTYYRYQMSDFYFNQLSTSFVSFLPYLPQSLWYGLFSPQIWETTSFLSLFEAIQNTILLTVCVFCLVNYLRSRKQIPFFVYPLLLYLFISSSLIAISSPNLGSLARYKTVYMPFLHFLLLYYLVNLLSVSGFAQFLAYFSGQKQGLS